MARSHNKIVLIGEAGRYEEGKLAAVTDCVPGMAAELLAAGTYDQQAEAVGEAIKSELVLFTEDSLNGGKSVDDALESGQNGVPLWICGKGDVVNVLVKNAEDIDVGDYLVVEGGGSGLFVEAAGTESRYQLKAVEGPGSLSGNTLVACRVL